MATQMVYPVKHSHASPVHQAYQLLHVGFVAAPIIAGIDKFFYFLADWNIYLSPVMSRLMPISNDAFIRLVGLVEIAAGILVAFRPRIGGYVVAIWLWAIILNLLSMQFYYDIALRDLGLSLAALALARLSESEVV